MDFSRVKMYGREKAVSVLHAMVDRVAMEDGAKETVLLYGYAGSGKTRLVQEALCSNTNNPNTKCLVGSGKFDQLGTTGCTSGNNGRPFSALLDAVTDLLAQMFRSEDEAMKQRLRQRLLDLNLGILVHLMPVTLFETVDLPEGDIVPDDDAVIGANTTSSISRIGRVLERILAAVALESTDKAVILFVDDLQFGDTETMDLLVYLTTSRTLCRVGFVLAYRDNEIHQEHPWADRLGKLNTDAQKIRVKGLSITNTMFLLEDLTRREDCIELAEVLYQKTLGNPFFALQVLDMLQRKRLLWYNVASSQWEWELDAIRTEVELTQNVIEVVVSKLQGMDPQVQLVVQVAACLGQRFDSGTLGEILGNPSTANNETAAPDESTITLRIDTVLQRVCRANLIEPVAPAASALSKIPTDEDSTLLSVPQASMSPPISYYRWSHDKIQEAAYSTIEQPVLMHWQIGLALKHKLAGLHCSKNNEFVLSSKVRVDDATILTVVFQLNQGISRAYRASPGEFFERDRIDLAFWNILAARISFSKSAFGYAIQFIEVAMALLVGENGNAMGIINDENDQRTVSDNDTAVHESFAQRHPWKTHYHMMVQLSILAIKAYFCVGRLDDSAAQMEVHYHHSKSIDDNLAVYPLEILMTQNGVNWLIDRGISILNTLASNDYSFGPTGSFSSWKRHSTKKATNVSQVKRKPGIVQVLRLYLRLKKRLQNPGPSGIKGLLQDLPIITGKRERTFYDILGNLTAACWTAGDHLLMAYLVLLGAQKQMDSGFVTAFPFALLTSVMGTLLQYDLASELSESVLAINDKTPREDQARSEICVRAFGMYRVPLLEHIDPTLRAHKLALEVGDNLWAGNAGTNYIQCCLHSGHLPLGELCKDATGINASMEKLQVFSCLEYVRPIIQALLNLNSVDWGDAAKFVQLDGKLANKKFYKSLPKDKLTVFHVYHTYQLMLALHFQDMDLCKEVTDIYWRSSKEPDGLLHANVAKRFYYGLAAYALANPSESSCGARRKQYRRGKSIERQLKALARNGSVNCVHLLQGLVAERLALAKRTPRATVKEAFDKAISLGLRAGFVADTALIYHRAAIYFRQQNDEDLAKRYTGESIELYTRWEAWAVVRYMCDAYRIHGVACASSFSVAGASTMNRISIEGTGSSRSLQLFQ